MPTITVYDDAPVITTTRAGRRFPADYGRLADCWDLAWAALSGGEWVAGLELAWRMAQHGDVAHDTAENLLRAGRKYGLLEVRHRLYGTPADGGPSTAPPAVGRAVSPGGWVTSARARRWAR